MQHPGRSRTVLPLAAGTFSHSAQVMEHPHCLGYPAMDTDTLPAACQDSCRCGGMGRSSGRFPRLRTAADSHSPAFEQAGLQASNSQLQALLLVPRKQWCMLSFTRLECRSCQRLRLSYQLLGSGSRWRDGAPDRE